MWYHRWMIIFRFIKNRLDWHNSVAGDSCQLWGAISAVFGILSSEGGGKEGIWQDHMDQSRIHLDGNWSLGILFEMLLDRKISLQHLTIYQKKNGTIGNLWGWIGRWTAPPTAAGNNRQRSAEWSVAGGQVVWIESESGWSSAVACVWPDAVWQLSS